jgi:hypothetical protein
MSPPPPLPEKHKTSSYALHSAGAIAKFSGNNCATPIGAREIDDVNRHAEQKGEQACSLA